MHSSFLKIERKLINCTSFIQQQQQQRFIQVCKISHETETYLSYMNKTAVFASTSIKL